MKSLEGADDAEAVRRPPVDAEQKDARATALAEIFDAHRHPDETLRRPCAIPSPGAAAIFA
jgi:hypothetical protein